MERALILLVFLAGCCTPSPRPTPLQRQFNYDKRRPQDMTDRVLGDERYPSWFKQNYTQWIRYAYDLERENRTK